MPPPRRRSTFGLESVFEARSEPRIVATPAPTAATSVVNTEALRTLMRVSMDRVRPNCPSCGAENCVSGCGFMDLARTVGLYAEFYSEHPSTILPGEET